MTLTQVQPVFNKKHLVTEILVTFSGAVDATEAQETGIYRLVTPGKHGSFTAKNAGSIKLRSAVYDAASDTVTLTPKKAFSLSKPVELTINGNPPSGLQDTFGRLIDGDDDGTPGGNAAAVLRRSGVVIERDRPRTIERRSDCFRPRPSTLCWSAENGWACFHELRLGRHR